LGLLILRRWQLSVKWSLPGAHQSSHLLRLVGEYPYQCGNAGIEIRDNDGPAECAVSVPSAVYSMVGYFFGPSLMATLSLPFVAHERPGLCQQMRFGHSAWPAMST